MVRNEIKMKSQEGDIFDKKQIALAIRKSTIDDELSCSFVEEGIIKCEACGLKDICNELDKIAENYLEKTTKILSSFNF